MSLRYNLNCPRLSADCTKCYGKKPDGTIDRTVYMTPCCQNPSCYIPTFVELHRIGADSWNRHLYRTNNGIVLCDTNLGHGELRLCTMTEQGEPDCPIHFDYVVVKDEAKERIERIRAVLDNEELCADAMVSEIAEIIK